MPPSRELGGDGSWLRAHPDYHPEEHVAPAAPVVQVPVDPNMVGADERGCAGVKPGMSQLDRTDGFKAFKQSGQDPFTTFPLCDDGRVPLPSACLG